MKCMEWSIMTSNNSKRLTDAEKVAIIAEAFETKDGLEALVMAMATGVERKIHEDNNPTIHGQVDI